MKYILKVWEGRIQRWVRNYKTAADLLEETSEEGWSRLRESKN